MKQIPMAGGWRLAFLLPALLSPSALPGQDAPGEPEAHAEEAFASGFRVGSWRTWIW